VAAQRTQILEREGRFSTAEIAFTAMKSLAPGLFSGWRPARSLASTNGRPRAFNARAKGDN